MLLGPTERVRCEHRGLPRRSANGPDHRRLNHRWRGEVAQIQLTGASQRWSRIGRAPARKSFVGREQKMPQPQQLHRFDHADVKLS